MGYKLNGSPLSLDVAFTDSEGTNYPSNWLRLSTATDRAAVPTGGKTWETEPAWYDQEFYWGIDKPKRLNDVSAYGDYDAEGNGIGPVTGTEYGLKTRWIQKQKRTANTLLAKTDWLVVRKAESGTAIPTTQANYRTAIRTQCALREATINACSSVDALCATMRNTLAPKIAGTASNGATEKKQEDGSSYDPIQYNDIANPDLLEEWPTEPTQDLL